MPRRMDESGAITTTQVILSPEISLGGAKLLHEPCLGSIS